MFSFLKKNSAARKAQCGELLRMIKPELEALMIAAPGPSDSAMSEYYGTAYFLWLVREKTDWKAIRPYLSAEAFDSLFYMRRANARARRKYIADIRDYWRAVERAEHDLHQIECSPLAWLEHRSSGLAAIADRNPYYGDQLLGLVCSLIRRLELKNYEAYCPPIESDARPSLSDIRPQPPRAVESITIADRHGNSVKMQVMDIITTSDGTFACMRQEQQMDILVFKHLTLPDGQTVYCPATATETRLVLAIFRTRNPQYFSES